MDRQPSEEVQSARNLLQVITVLFAFQILQ